ncbi:hypothetical protein Pfo_011710, partial [Paulownia fortunei]
WLCYVHLAKRKHGETYFNAGTSFSSKFSETHGPALGILTGLFRGLSGAILLKLMLQGAFSSLIATGSVMNSSQSELDFEKRNQVMLTIFLFASNHDSFPVGITLRAIFMVQKTLLSQSGRHESSRMQNMNIILETVEFVVETFSITSEDVTAMVLIMEIHNLVVLWRPLQLSLHVDLIAASLIPSVISSHVDDYEAKSKINFTEESET